MKILNYNPYDYNSISLKNSKHSASGGQAKQKMIDNKKFKMTPTASQLIAIPRYNYIAKFLGIDTHWEWSEYYQKVQEIVDWAEEKAKTDDIKKILEVIIDKVNSTPQMNSKRINDLYIGIQLNPEVTEEKKEVTEEKKEVKEEENVKEENEKTEEIKNDNS